MIATKTKCDACGVEFRRGDTISMSATTTLCANCAGITEYSDGKRDLYDCLTCGFVVIVRFIKGGYRARIVGSNVMQQQLQETADAAAIDIAQAYGYAGTLSSVRFNSYTKDPYIYITGRIDDPAFVLVDVPEVGI